MRDHAARPSPHELGFTAALCPNTGSHNRGWRSRQQTPRLDKAVRPRRCLMSNVNGVGSRILVLLLVLFFLQHGAAFALVGRSKPLSIPSSTVSRPMLDQGSAWPATEESTELRKRQSQTPTLASDPSATSSLSLPLPLDGRVGINFTQPSCPLYMQEFLADPAFQSCHAVSMLLVVSVLSKSNE